jgi:hypothetical protein
MSPELVKRRSPRGHLLSLRSKLGKAAVIGGQAYVERFATSEEFAAIYLYGLDPASRKAAIEMVVRIAERTRQSPPPVRAPSRNERLKIRWTDELIARLKAEAPKCTHDIELAARLGFPPWCRDAIRRARGWLGMFRGQPRSSRHRASPVAPSLIAA